MAGELAYDGSAQQYTLKGGGANIWGVRDEFVMLTAG